MSTSFQISGRHLEITEALKEYTLNKVSKIEKFFENAMSIHVILSVDNHLQIAEAEVKIDGDQNSIFAIADSDNMYKSIDLLEHKLLTQVKKYHDKLKGHHEGCQDHGFDWNDEK